MGIGGWSLVVGRWSLVVGSEGSFVAAKPSSPLQLPSGQCGFLCHRPFRRKGFIPLCLLCVLSSLRLCAFARNPALGLASPYRQGHRIALQGVAGRSRGSSASERASLRRFPSRKSSPDALQPTTNDQRPTTNDHLRPANPQPPTANPLFSAILRQSFESGLGVAAFALDFHNLAPERLGAGGVAQAVATLGRVPEPLDVARLVRQSRVKSL
jgi:hypothetical protein